MSDPDASATGTAEPPGDEPAEPAAPAPPPTTAGAVAPAEPSGPTDPPGRARRSWVTATSVAVLVVGLVVTAAVGTLAFTTNDGAETPEAAIGAMLDAVRRNDLIGIVEQLPPGERKALRDPVARLATQMQRLRLVGTLDPRRVPGPIFTFEDLQLRTTALSDDVRTVDLVGGRLRAQWPGGGQPLTEHAHQILAREWGITIDPVDASYSRDFARERLRLVTIREGGGWHVSLAYSAAEALRAESTAPIPQMGQGPAAVGAEVPEKAVTDLVRAYADADPERLVTLSYPDEARALYDYAPGFLPGAYDAAREAADQRTYDVQLNKVETSVEGSGERRLVRITALDVDIRDEVHKQHLWWADGCFHADRRVGDDDEPFAKTDSCSRDRPRAGDVTAERNNPISALAVFGGGADLPTFTVIERNGRWFVSPVHTLADSLADTLEKMSPEDLDGFAERWADTWDGGAGAGVSGEPIRPTARDVAADPSKAGVRGKVLADRCATLTTGPQAAAVLQACLAHLVDQRQVKAEDLPPDARELIGR